SPRFGDVISCADSPGVRRRSSAFLGTETEETMISARRGLPLASVLAVGAATMVTAVSTATGKTPPASFKPVIGKPVTAPAQPTAGKSLAVTYRVTRSDTGKPLLAGTMASRLS